MSNQSSQNFGSVLQRVGETADFYGRQVTDPMTKGLFGNTPLHGAAVWGNIDAGRLLLEAGADPNAQGEYDYTSLRDAIDQGHFDFVKLLLEHGASTFIVNADGETAAVSMERSRDPRIRALNHR